MAFLSTKRVKAADWQENRLNLVIDDGREFSVTVPDKDAGAAAPLITAIERSGAHFQFDHPSTFTTIISLLAVIAFPLMILTVIYFLLIRPAQTTRGKALAYFSGIAPQRTEPFTVPPGRRAQFVWATSRGTNDVNWPDGNFIATLTNAADLASVQLIASVSGEASGATICYRHGTFCIDVVAEVGWVIKVCLL